MSPQLDPVAELETLKTQVDHSGSTSFSRLIKNDPVSQYLYILFVSQ